MTPEPVPRPVAWRAHVADLAWFAAEGKRCETRRCRNPVAVVTWRWFRSAAAGRVLVVEHFACDDHGQGFADRHHIQIEPPPAVPSRRRASPRERTQGIVTEPQAGLEASGPEPEAEP
jgi:hypothetical protein